MPARDIIMRIVEIHINIVRFENHRVQTDRKKREIGESARNRKIGTVQKRGRNTLQKENEKVGTLSKLLGTSLTE